MPSVQLPRERCVDIAHIVALLQSLPPEQLSDLLHLCWTLYSLPISPDISAEPGVGPALFAAVQSSISRIGLQ